MMTIEQATERVRAILDASNMSGGPRVDVFVGEADAVMDSDQRAHPYLVVMPGSGQRDMLDESLCGAAGARTWRFQVTAAGGDVARCMRAVTRAHQALVGVRLDETTSPVREDGDAGSILPDRSIAPTRWFLPLLYAVDLPADPSAP